jgi:hypothetical protein
VRLHLERLKRDVAAEIHDYPTPIAGCDAQFNHLLERQRALVAEIARLDAAGAGVSIEAFIASSPCLDEATRRAFLLEHQSS